MTMAPERIAVFYSHGQDFEQVLDAVRRRHPHAWICAILPEHYDVGEVERKIVDETVVVKQTSYRVVQLPDIAKLVRQIRGIRCDRFIVLFKSEQLRTLASLSGAAYCECWGVDSCIHRLAASPQGYIVEAIFRRAMGIKRCVTLWIRVRVFPVTRA